MGVARIALIVVALVGAIAAGLYFWRASHPPLLPQNPPASLTPAPLARATGPRHVIEPPPQEQTPLPRLNESDPAMAQALSALLGSTAFARFFVPEELVRHIVVTVDNLPRESVAARLNPVRPVGGLLRTTGQGETLAIAPENARRYAEQVNFAQSVDSAKIVALYARVYPLFQQAYVDLGYPDRYFNDRLVEVIDHMLAAPEMKDPVRITAPHVLYEYADPALEARSAGHKLMIRIGPENAAKVKAKLREIRAEVLAVSRKERALQ